MELWDVLAPSDSRLKLFLMPSPLLGLTYSFRVQVGQFPPPKIKKKILEVGEEHLLEGTGRDVHSLFVLLSTFLLLIGDAFPYNVLPVKVMK